MEIDSITEKIRNDHGYTKDRMQAFLNEEKSQKHVYSLLNKICKKYKFKLKNSLVVGAGRGGLTCNLLFDDNYVTSIEPYSPYVDVIKYKLLKYGYKSDVINDTCENVQLPSDFYDFVLLMDVIEHVNDPSKVLHKIYLSLSKRGFAYITVPNRFHLFDPHYKLPFICWMPSSWADYILVKAGRIKKDGVNGMQTLSSMHYYSYGRFLKIAHEIGFEVIDIRRLQNSHPSEFILQGGKFKKIAVLMKKFKSSWLMNFVCKYFFGHRFVLVKSDEWHD